MLLYMGFLAQICIFVFGLIVFYNILSYCIAGVYKWLRVWYNEREDCQEHDDWSHKG